MSDPLRKDIPAAVLPALCVACEARHRGVCAALDNEQLATLSRAAHRHVAGEGAELLGDAERVDNYANILSGVIKLTKTLSDGRRQIVGLQFAPDFLGRPFRAESAIDAQAATVVSLCSFPRTTLERLMREQPDLERRLLRQTLDDLDEARDWMVLLGRKTATEKVATFLLLIARNIDPEPRENRAPVFDLPLSRADIGDFLGLTVETVSRQLTRLRGDGLIRIENNRRVTITDMARLAARSGD